MGRMGTRPKGANVFGGGIPTLVTRLIEWSVAERDLPSDRFPNRSLRAGGEAGLYQSGVDVEYIRRFG